MRYAKIIALALLAVAPATYAQVKISDLPAAAALTGSEQLPAVQSAATTRATPAQLNTYVRSLSGAWTGTQTYNGRILANVATTGVLSSITATSSAPQIELNNSSAPVNNRRAINYVDATGLHRYAVCQDNTTCNDYLQVARTGSSVSAFRIYTNNTNERLSIDTNGAWTLGATPSTGTAGQVLTSTGASTPPQWQDAGAGVTLANGTWTPVCTAGANMTTCNASAGNYIRVGNQVTFTIAFSSTGPGATQTASVTVPVATANTGNNLYGTCVGTGASGSVGRLAAGGANTITVNLNTTQTVSIPFACTGMYTVN